MELEKLKVRRIEVAKAGDAFQVMTQDIKAKLAILDDELSSLDADVLIRNTDDVRKQQEKRREEIAKEKQLLEAEIEERQGTATALKNKLAQIDAQIKLCRAQEKERMSDVIATLEPRVTDWMGQAIAGLACLQAYTALKLGVRPGELDPRGVFSNQINLQSVHSLAINVHADMKGGKYD